MKVVFSTLIGMLLLAGAATAAWADPFVGVVKLSEGGAVIQRNGKTLIAGLGTEVMPADAIKTDEQGAVGLVFSDDTRVSMGPDTEITIERYQFAPKVSKFSFVLHVIRGTVSFLSGQITKLAPESVKLVVPDATIGVRGTHVLIKVD